MLEEIKTRKTLEIYIVRCMSAILKGMSAGLKKTGGNIL